MNIQGEKPEAFEKSVNILRTFCIFLLLNHRVNFELTWKFADYPNILYAINIHRDRSGEKYL
jgi:hypothetical protein